MKKAVVILFMTIYGLGMLLYPMGDFACSRSLISLYHHCQGEDPDLDIADFVFEHLLNLDDVIDCFEHEEQEKNEKPHQPFQYTQAPAPMPVVVSKLIYFEATGQEPVYSEASVYSLYKQPYIPLCYLTEVFHPPSAC